MSVMLAKNWAGTDPTGWWMSEKLDGIRAVWDGVSLNTRTGQPIYAPAWFISSLPSIHLDGELWIGRGQFQQTASVVRSRSAGEEWRLVRYAAFDAPAVSGGFEARQAVLRECVSGVAFALGQRRCDGAGDLAAELARITSAGGEGVMLREPGSDYERRRAPSLLKVKTFLDTEATVIGYERGTGRNRTAVGSLVARMQDGTEFRVSSGLTDAMRRDPPAVGTVITVAYQQLTDAGVPRFPSFLRVA